MFKFLLLAKKIYSPFLLCVQAPFTEIMPKRASSQREKAYAATPEHARELKSILGKK